MVLDAQPSVSWPASPFAESAPRIASACAQSIASAAPGGLISRAPRRRATAPRLSGRAARRRRGAKADDLDLALEVGEVDPVVETAALERVVQLPRTVRGDDDGRRAVGAIVPSSGTVTEKSESTSSRNASNSSSARSSSSISSTAPRARPDRLEQRPLEQELRPVELVHALVHVELARLERPRVEQLARVVPLVERLRRVDALVALEPDQLRVRGSARASSRPRSCRLPARPRAAAAGASRARGRSPSRARGRGGTTPRGAPARPRERIEAPSRHPSGRRGPRRWHGRYADSFTGRRGAGSTCLGLPSAGEEESVYPASFEYFAPADARRGALDPRPSRATRPRSSPAARA